MKKISIIFSFFLVFALVLSIFSMGKVAATENDEPNPEQLINISSYEIRPLLEELSYSVYDEIPVIIDVEADSLIQSFNCEYNGFIGATPFSIENNCVVGSIMCNSATEEAAFNISITLENGASLMANLFGFVVDDNVYLNVNSMFGARDIYWSEVLNSGLRTEAEYIAYISGKPQDTTINTTQIENGSASTAATNNITVSGTIQWKDDWGNNHPVQYTKVVVMDKGGGFLGLWDTELGTTYTNSNGYYSLSFTKNGACKPYLNIYPEGENTVVKTGSGNDYLWSTEPREGVTSYASIGVTIPMTSENGRAFQISQAIISASKFMDIICQTDIEPVTVIYPHNINGEGCFYDKYEKTIYIVGDRDNDIIFDGKILRSYASWDVIQHEYFHHVQDQLEITANPGGWHGVGTNMYVHYISDHTSSSPCYYNGKFDCYNPELSKAKSGAIKLAYAEAVASVLGGIAQDYMINIVGTLNSNIHTLGDTEYTSYNGASIDYEGAYISKGEVNETSVAGILWDIFDNESELHDSISLGYQGFWNALLKNKNKTLSEFVASLYDTYPQYKELLGNTLWYYNATAALKNIANTSLKALPTFSWTALGSESDLYQNNRFELVFYNQYKYEILRKTVSTTSYTLTENEWNTILSDSGDYFYWNVGACHDDGYGCITGPYYSSYKKVNKPTATSLTTSSSISGSLSGAGDYLWYRFVAPSSGTYTFYTTSSIDTYGDMFAKPIYGLSNAGRLAYDDDGGESLNFSITYELDYQQTVFIRVKGYGSASGNYTIFATFNKHIHHYNVSYVHNDTSTHRCYCDCGEYEDEEHDWIGIGTNKIRCVYCMLTVTGTVPGGSISSIGDDEMLDTMVFAALPVEVLSEEDD